MKIKYKFIIYFYRCKCITNKIHLNLKQFKYLECEAI